MTRPPPRSIYDDDFFAWTREQAAALREMPPHVVSARLDIAHVAEEIEDLGKRDLREVSSYLARLFEHIIKTKSCPASVDVPRWLPETGHFRDSATDACSPSMRQLIDLDKIWRRGRQQARDFLQASGIAIAVPLDCPFTLDDLLSEGFEIQRALTKVGVTEVDSSCAGPLS